MPIVSVIVPLYNSGRFVEETIRSLQAQTLRDLEIIIVDDGSTDDGPEICRLLCEKDSRIRLISQANQGVSAARNTGILAAQGEALTFMDSDDWASPDLCEILWKRLERDRADIAIAGIIFEYAGRQEMHSLPFEETVWERPEIEGLFIPALLAGRVSDGRLTGCYVGTGLYKRALLLERDIYFHGELKRSEDPLFLLEAAEAASRISISAYCGYHYRKNSFSVSERFGSDLFDQWQLARPYFERFSRLHTRCAEAYMDRLFLSMSMEFKNYSRPGSPYGLCQQRLHIQESLEQYWAKELIENDSYNPTLRYQRLVRFLAKHRLYLALALIYGFRNKIKREAVVS